MAEKPATVTMRHPDGTEETGELAPDDYMVLTGPQREVAGLQQYANGTVVLTIKAVKPDA